MIRALAVLLVASLPALADGPVRFPDTPAGKKAEGYLAAFDRGTADAMREFESKNRAAASLARTPMEERLSLAHQLFEDTGGLDATRIVQSSPYEIVVAAVGRKSGMSLLLTFQLEEAEPHGLAGISIEPDTGDVSGPVDADARREVVDGVARELTAAYVFPDVAAKMIDSIQGRLRDGKYDACTDGRTFASHLTDDLQAVSHDKHLRVRAGRMPEERFFHGPGGASDGDRDWTNNDFVRVERLGGNVGYLKLNGLRPGLAAERTSAAAMAFLANSSALVIDLRENGGGSPEAIAFLLSYLFEGKVLLNTFFDRVQNTTTESWTRAEIPGRRFDATIPVWVLTSARTFSGAEELAYDLQNLKRATIVGETTGGGAHPVMPRPISHDFTVMVPFARAINPITKTNWEGVGVKPDVAVPADKALYVAHRAALEKILPKTDPDERREVEAALRAVNKSLEQ
jgi:peptidase S41-like protein